MRIRTIKPEFYQDEALAQAPRAVRLLAAALITWADDEGYFPSHPALIAGSLFPFDEDAKEFVADGLTRLAAIGFVHLFEGSVGFLPGFTRHQRINRPTPSRLKAKAVNQVVVSPHGVLSEPSPKAKAVNQVVVSPHGVLSEPSPTEGKGREGNGRDQEGKTNSAKADEPSAPSPQEQLRQVWNDHRGTKLPEWRDSKHRNTPARERLKDRPLSEWVVVVKRIAASAFCTGTNDRGWKADPDWLLKAGSAVKVLEGKYDGTATAGLGWRDGVDHSQDFMAGVGT